jgi:glucokinase
MKKTAIGIDIGGTNTAFGWVDREGNMQGQGKLSTSAYPDVELYQQALSEAIRTLIRTSECEIVGVGIGAPNANYYAGTIENAPNLPWKGIVPFAETFSRFFSGLPVVITNDANAAALGEKMYGAAREMDDFIVITLGTGLGSGFVTGGKLLLGHSGLAGELGHVTVEPGGRLCGCGRRGCLETYASATGIRRTVFQLLADRTEPCEFRGITYDELTAERITQAARRGDPLALAAYEYTGEQLGRALATTVLITEPEAIFLFGGLARAGEYLFEPVKRHLEQSLLPLFQNRVDIRPSGLPEGDAAILGAAALIWNRIEESK